MEESETRTTIPLSTDLRQRLKIVSSHSGRLLQDIMQEAVETRVAQLESELGLKAPPARKDRK